MNNTFMKNIFSKTKNVGKDIVLFYIFANVFNVQCNRKQLYSHVCSAFNLLWHVLVEV